MTPLGSDTASSHIDHDHQSDAVLTVFYAGAEVPSPDALEKATGVPVASNPRALAAYIEKATHTEGLLVVIPAGTDRDLTSVTQAAQALHWARRSGSRVALGASLIDATRTIAELRRHLRKARDQDAVLFIATSVDPFADAELLRRVRLARQFSENIEVEVAFDGSWPSEETARERLRRLGAESVMTIRADLALQDEEPLFRPSALVTAVERASHAAVHLYRDHHDDGIDAGLLADHATGFAHSHGEDGHSHSHGQSHSHAHSHTHHH